MQHAVMPPSPRRGGRRALAAGLFALLATIATARPARAQLRHLCVGQVVDDHNGAVPDATVTLAWTGFADSDVVTCRSDERGYFRAELIVARPYSAWAITGADDRGAQAISDVEAVAAGQVLELVALHRRGPRAVPVRGLDAWRSRRPIALEWFRGPGVTTLQTLGGDECVLLPPGPACPSSLRLRTLDGEIAAVTNLAAGDGASAEFAAPAEHRVVVVNARGDPVPCAEVEQQAGGTWCRAGVTGDDGATIGRFVNAATLSDAGWLRARAGGAIAFTTFAAARRIDRALAITLPEPRRHTARILGLLAGETVAGAAHGIVQSPPQRRKNTLALALPVTVRGDELAVDAMPEPFGDVEFELLLAPRQSGTPRIALTPTVAGDSVDLPDVDLRALTQVHLCAVDAANNPLPGAALGVMDVAEGYRWGTKIRWFVLDHAGRVDLLLAPGTRWAVYVAGQREQATQILAAGVAEVRLVTAALPTLRCRVVDEDGRPVRGARLEREPQYLGGSSVHRGDDLHMVRTAFGQAVAWRLATAARSDADGMLIAPIEDWTDWRAIVHIAAGTRVSTPFELHGGEDRGDVQVR